MMNVVTNLIVFIILLAIGWIAYERHDPFRDLIKDIAQYYGLMAHHTQHPSVTDAQDPAPIQPAAGMAHNQPADTAHNTGTKTPSPPPAADVTTRPPPPPHAPPPPVAALQQPLVEQPPQPPPAALADETDPAAPATSATDTQGTTPPPQNSGADHAAAQAKPAMDTTAVTPPQDKQPDDPRATPQAAPMHPTTTADRAARRKQNALAGLTAARQAWHSGKTPLAIEQYQYLMQEYANHPDFAGELGNIYLAHGKTQLAVDAYSEAVVRLLKNGDTPRARKTLHIIHNLNQQRAHSLQQRFVPLR